MADLAQLTAWRDAIRAARYSGIKSVEIGGRRTEYKSDNEMRQAEADLSAQIAQAQSGRRFGVVHIVSDKGI